MFVEHATSERVINQNDLTFEAMALQVRERKPVSSDEHLILPIKSLLNRTSLAGIDLFNTFASCLEEHANRRSRNLTGSMANGQANKNTAANMCQTA